MPRSAPSPPWSSRLCFPVDQLGRLFGSDALPQERRPWRRRRRLSLSIHTGRYTSFPLWTSGKNGTQMRIFSYIYESKDNPPLATWMHCCWLGSRSASSSSSWRAAFVCPRRVASVCPSPVGSVCWSNREWLYSHPGWS